MRAIDEIRGRLSGLRQNGEGWVARCPAHDDRNPSLSLREASDGRVLLHCFAGCSYTDVLAAIGLSREDLYPDSGNARPRLASFAMSRKLSVRELEAWGVRDCDQGIAIPYLDEAGEVLFRKYRVKEHGPNHYRADKGANLVPYGLWRLADVGERSSILIVEGETDAWTLWHHGFHALGIAGANAARTLRREHVAGVETVHIVREADEAGAAFASSVESRVKGWGLSARIVDLPHKDVSDFYISVGSSEGFRAALEEILAADGESGLWRLPDLLAAKFPEPLWLVEDILPEGLTLLVGAPKAGKSRLITNVSLAVGNGGQAVGTLSTHRAGVLYLDLEQGERASQGRFRDLSSNDAVPKGFFVVHDWPLMGQGGVTRIERALDKHPDVRLVVVDTLAKVWSLGKSSRGNAYNAEYEALSRFKRVAQDRKIALVLVHHESKFDGPDKLYRASGTNAMTGVPDTIWMLGRKRSESGGSLYVTGREVREQSLDLEFDPQLGTWCAAAPWRPRPAVN